MVTQPKTSRSRRKPATAPETPPRKPMSRMPKRRKGENLYLYLIRLGDSLPAEDAAKFPPDMSWNLDHYLYGTPKKPPPDDIE